MPVPAAAGAGSGASSASNSRDGWDSLLGAHKGAMLGLANREASLRGTVEAQRLQLAELEARVSRSVRAPLAEIAEGDAEAERGAEQGSAAEQWGSVRLLARAVRPLRLRCSELSSQKELLRAQVPGTD